MTDRCGAVVSAAAAAAVVWCVSQTTTNCYKLTCTSKCNASNTCVNHTNSSVITSTLSLSGACSINVVHFDGKVGGALAVSCRFSPNVAIALQCPAVVEICCLYVVCNASVL